MPIVQSDLRTKSSGPRLAQQPRVEPRLLRSKTGPYVAPRLATVDSPASRDRNGTIETPERAYSEVQYYPSSAAKYEGISPNITPRSGARRSRIQEASPTANSTVGIVTASTWTPTPVTSTKRGGFVRNGQVDSTVLTNEVTPSHSERQPFFLAGDAQSIVQSQKPAPSGFNPQPKSFFYANGEKENDIQTQQDYFYTTPDTNTVALGPELYPPHQIHDMSAQRHFATSPVETGLPSITPQRGAPLRRLSSFADRAASAKAQSASSTPVAQSRPVSYDRTTQQNSTSRETRPPSRYSGSSFVQLGYNEPANMLYSNSAGMQTNGDGPRPILSPPQANVRPPSPLKMASYSMSTVQSEATHREPSPQRGPDSPTSTADSEKTNSKLDRMNELANNARRERKVLDLEISNSSLLAINRTLEKEMRKQTHELRRFRRLMQSGRLSLTELAPMDEDSDEDDENGSDTDSQTDSQDEDEHEGSEQDLENASSRDRDSDSQYLVHGSKSRRATDTRRMRLDLSKHQEILNDTRKMNESLRRCLARSEALLKDATSALSHEVPSHELRLGGRILISEDDEAHEEQSKALLSPGVSNRFEQDNLDEFRWHNEAGKTDGSPGSPENDVTDQDFEEIGDESFGDESFENEDLEEQGTV